jgi:hypothetical protein
MLRFLVLRTLVAMFGATLLAAPVLAQVVPFPPSFHTQDIETNGTTIHVRVGG